MARRRGRKQRKSVERTASGVLRRTSEERDIVPVEALMRRSEILGVQGCERPRRGRPRSDAINLTKVDASCAAGVLFARGIILQCHYDAAKRLLDAREDWDRAVSETKRVASVSRLDEAIGPIRAEMTEEEWERIKRRYIGALNSVPIGILRAAIKCVILDDVLPPRLLDRDDAAVSARNVMVRALEILCAYYGIAINTEDA
jgi:hypothetical protein